MCTIAIAVPKGRTAADVALQLRGKLRPKVYDCSRSGYRELKFDVVERGKEVLMTIHGVSGNEETDAWGYVDDNLKSLQLSCTLQAPVQKAA